MYQCTLIDGNKIQIKSKHGFSDIRKNALDYYCTTYNLETWTKKGHWEDCNGRITVDNEPFLNVNESNEKWVRENYFAKVGLNKTDFPRKKDAK